LDLYETVVQKKERAHPAIIRFETPKWRLVMVS
jgi:hypothetical protein